MSGFTPITWTNGVTAVNQTNMQRYDDWIQQAEADSGVVTLNGSTSGTAKLYQVMQGLYKKCLIRLNNFRNGGGSAQTLTLPTPFTDFADFRSYQMAQYQVKNGGSALTLFYMSSIGASGFGATSATTINASLNVLFVTDAGAQPFDTISFNSGAAGSNTGFLIIEGM